jgi:type IV pilus assembly protein PilC
MGQFLYEALDKGGKQVKGIIEASSEEVIIDKLHGMGYYPLRVVPHKKTAGEFDILALPILKNIFHRVKFKHIVMFSRQLATLIDAGLPIIRSLAILQEQTESVMFKEALKKIAKDIESGSSLSEAFAKHPKIFDKLYVNMVRAGEIGGVLEGVLNKIAMFLEKRQALISKVKSAMMYPIVVLGMATIIVSGILIFIIPRFADIFAQLGATLPLPTLILVHASDIMMHRGYLIFIFIGIVIFIYKKLNGWSGTKLYIDKAKMGFPLLGDLVTKVAISRFADTLSTLINSGVPILQSLDIVRDTSGNEIISRAMKKVYENVKDGDTIHEPLKESGVFPPLVIHMVAVGEETGAIDHMLTKVAEAYERDVNDTVDALTSIMEPLLIVFLGVIIGSIVIALYLPYFMIPGLID